MIMARTVARRLSKKYHQDTGLTLKPWNRTIWNMITNRRNLHPVYAHCTQLCSMILIQSEDKARDTLDFGLILAKHMSLLHKKCLNYQWTHKARKESVPRYILLGGRPIVMQWPFRRLYSF